MIVTMMIESILFFLFVFNKEMYYSEMAGQPHSKISRAAVDTKRCKIAWKKETSQCHYWTLEGDNAKLVALKRRFAELSLIIEYQIKLFWTLMLMPKMCDEVERLLPYTAHCQHSEGLAAWFCYKYNASQLGNAGCESSLIQSLCRPPLGLAEELEPPPATPPLPRT